MSEERGQTPREASSIKHPDEPIGHYFRCEVCHKRVHCDGMPHREAPTCDTPGCRDIYYRLRRAKREGKRYWLGGALALFLTCSFLSPSSARAGGPPRDWLTTSLFLASSAALVIDLGQTIDRGEGAAGPERNPLLGERPGRAAAWGYFGGLLAAEAATYLWAPRWASRTVSALTLAIEIPVIERNFRVGVRVRF